MRYAAILTLAILTGCATYSQVMIGPSGEVMQCSTTGGGLMGMAAASSATGSCVEDLEQVGYRKIEQVGVIGIRWEEQQIVYVEPDSPAEIAGIAIGDVIRMVDGEFIETDRELGTRMAAGPMVYVVLVADRAGEEIEFKVRRIAYTKLYGTNE